MFFCCSLWWLGAGFVQDPHSQTSPDPSFSFGQDHAEKIPVYWHEQSKDLLVAWELDKHCRAWARQVKWGMGGPDPPPSSPFQRQGLWAMALALACQVKFGCISTMDNQCPCNSREMEERDRAAGPLCHSWAGQASENLTSTSLSGWRGVPVCKGDSAHQKSSHTLQCRWLMYFWGKIKQKLC